MSGEHDEIRPFFLRDLEETLILVRVSSDDRTHRGSFLRELLAEVLEVSPCAGFEPLGQLPRELHVFARA
jgi:hypothetical protein